MGSSHKLAPLVRIDSVASTVNVVVNRQVDRNSRPLYAYLVLYSLLTGYIAAVAFTATSIWVAAQTGNTVQLGMAIAQSFSPGSGPTSTRRRLLHINDRQAMCSLFTFALAVQAGRIVGLLGRKRRRTHAVSTLIQALLTGAAALTCHFSVQSDFGNTPFAPSWTDALGFTTLALLSGSLGLQGVTCEWIGAPHGATVVITSLFPQLGAMEWSAFTKLGRQPVRDAKIITIAVFAIGGLTGRAMLGAIGSPYTLMIAAIIKLCMAFGWCFMNAEYVSTPLPMAA